MGASVVTWNVQWARPSVRASIRQTLVGLAPDILVVTEGVISVLPDQGHVALGGPDWGYPTVGERRKVMLWSPHRLSLVNRFEELPLPSGRLVTAVCEMPGIGPVWIVGVCIPWRDAHVRTGRADGQPWQEHLQFLAHLPDVLRRAPEGLPVVLAGDLNQRIPTERVPAAVATALAAALGDMQVATAGHLPGLEQRGVDHICHSPVLTTERRWGVSRVDSDNRVLSDHDLVGVMLT